LNVLNSLVLHDGVRQQTRHPMFTHLAIPFKVIVVCGSSPGACQNLNLGAWSIKFGVGIPFVNTPL
jgi:hypothetical protein